jgi:hypothetical protein
MPRAGTAECAFVVALYLVSHRYITDTSQHLEARAELTCTRVAAYRSSCGLGFEKHPAAPGSCYGMLTSSKVLLRRPRKNTCLELALPTTP